MSGEGGDGTKVEVDPSLAAARNITASGLRVQSAWAKHGAAIEGINNQKPWGTDDAGAQFEKNYSVAPDLLNNGTQVVQAYENFGPTITQATKNTKDTDDSTTLS